MPHVAPTPALLTLDEARSVLLTVHKSEGIVWFFHNHERLTPDAYWPILRDVWQMDESPMQGDWRPAWVAMLTKGDMFDCEAMMTPAEQAEHDAQPPRVTLYRGENDGYEPGLAWTFDPEVARWFAMRSARFADARGEKPAPVLLTVNVEMDHVAAILHERSESEALIPHVDEVLGDIERTPLEYVPFRDSE